MVPGRFWTGLNVELCSSRADHRGTAQEKEEEGKGTAAHNKDWERERASSPNKPPPNTGQGDSLTARKQQAQGTCLDRPYHPCTVVRPVSASAAGFSVSAKSPPGSRWGILASGV
jgi:hypothetical protein